jgi:hypothetical protein
MSHQKLNSIRKIEAKSRHNSYTRCSHYGSEKKCKTISNSLRHHSLFPYKTVISKDISVFFQRCSNSSLFFSLTNIPQQIEELHLPRWTRSNPNYHSPRPSPSRPSSPPSRWPPACAPSPCQPEVAAALMLQVMATLAMAMTLDVLMRRKSLGRRQDEAMVSG